MSAITASFPCCAILITAAAAISVVPVAKAVDTQETPAVSVTKSDGDLVLVEKKGTTRLITPSTMFKRGRFSVRVPRPKAVVESPAEVKLKTPSVTDRVNAQKYLFAANQAFFDSELDKAWALVDRAEQLDPTDHRIMNMKGSLLYRTGSKDLAVALWKQSLKARPDQPDIKKMLETASTAGLPDAQGGVKR